MMVVAVLFVFSIFAAQLLRLQGFDASATSQDALSSSRMATVAIPAMRGSILDSQRHGARLEHRAPHGDGRPDGRRRVQEDRRRGVHQGGRGRRGRRPLAAARHPGRGAPADAHRRGPVPHPAEEHHAAQLAQDRRPSAIPGIYSEPTSERNYPTADRGRVAGRLPPVRRHRRCGRRGPDGQGAVGASRARRPTSRPSTAASSRRDTSRRRRRCPGGTSSSPSTPTCSGSPRTRWRRR